MNSKNITTFWKIQVYSSTLTTFNRTLTDEALPATLSHFPLCSASIPHYGRYRCFHPGLTKSRHTHTHTHTHTQTHRYTHTWCSCLCWWMEEFDRKAVQCVLLVVPGAVLTVTQQKTEGKEMGHACKSVWVFIFCMCVCFRRIRAQHLAEL